MAALANVPLWAQAGLWGLLAGSALLIGALAGYFLALPQRLVAAVMAFGSGVLISALAFELMDQAYDQGGFAATAEGFFSGAFVFTAANWLLARLGARNRKRSGEQHPSPEEGGGAAIAVGALIDGIPESIVMGVSLIAGERISMVVVAAVFLSNIPEGLSSCGVSSRSSAASHRGWVTPLSAVSLRQPSPPSWRSPPAPSWQCLSTR